MLYINTDEGRHRPKELFCVIDFLQSFSHTLSSFKIVSSLHSLVGQSHSNGEGPSLAQQIPSLHFPPSTHRVNLRQHCHNVSAQHLPSLPEDVAGKGISLLSTWGREEGMERVNTQGGSGPQLLSFSLCRGAATVRVRWLAEVSIRNRRSPHGVGVSQPPELPLVLTHRPPPATSTLGRVSWTEVAHSRHSGRAAPLGKTLAPGLYSNLH